MQAHKVRVDVPDDHRITVELPEGFPAGPAEVIVLAAGGEGRRIVRAGGALSAVEPVAEGEDPIADALDELRRERAAGLERRGDDLGPAGR
jgi:hypothetical protein